MCECKNMHYINNQNNVKIDGLDEFIVVPIGNRCYTTLICDRAELRVCALPFDWVYHVFPTTILMELDSNFEFFIPEVEKGIYTNKNNIKFPHFYKKIEDGIFHTKKTIDRFVNILNSDVKIYFIYMLYDCITEKEWRTDNFNIEILNNFNIFEKHLEKKFPQMNYGIILISFYEHINLPINSKILQIVLNSEYFYDKKSDFVVCYCKDLLKTLFKKAKPTLKFS